MDGDIDKASFWKKNAKTVPGRYCIVLIMKEFVSFKIFIIIFFFRPSPKRENKNFSKAKTPGSTSFQDFQASVSDAWDLDDDEFCVISGIKSENI